MPDIEPATGCRTPHRSGHVQTLSRRMPGTASRPLSGQVRAYPSRRDVDCQAFEMACIFSRDTAYWDTLLAAIPQPTLPHQPTDPCNNAPCAPLPPIWLLRHWSGLTHAPEGGNAV